MISNLHNHILLLELVGNNCHSGPKEPKRTVIGKHDESPVTTLPIFCIMKIHRLGPGSNPQPQAYKASDKPTIPPRRLLYVYCPVGTHKRVVPRVRPPP
ncbi:hypothetical protein TNCV_2038261 [Trichonephila clavipes]|nr:hypothetical protein TNCV_2038261 [Trichonephila clavipes]